MITRRTRTLLALPFAVLATLLLAACPSDDGPSPEEMQRNPPVVGTDRPTAAAT